MKALVVIDLQNDFCPGGALGVQRGGEIAQHIAKVLTSSVMSQYAAVCTTQDWHIVATDHFAQHATPNRPPDFVTTWPRHCLAESEGASIRPDIRRALAQLSTMCPGLPVLRFYKGQSSAAYSGFEASTYPNFLPGQQLDEQDSFEGVLRAHQIEELDICGIATDYCVLATALDALQRGFKVNVLTNMVAAVNESSGVKALQQVEKAGATLISH